MTRYFFFYLQSIFFPVIFKGSNYFFHQIMYPERIERRILRLASDVEIEKLAEKESAEEEALRICQEKLVECNLPITLSYVEFQFDRKRLTLFYWATERIDFRHYVRTLFQIFRTRIWMQHVQDDDGSSSDASRQSPSSTQ